jgi:hypothetical protein
MVEEQALPIEDTATLMLRALLFTQKMPSARDGQDSRQALLSQVKGPSGRDQAAPRASRKT